MSLGNSTDTSRTGVGVGVRGIRPKKCKWEMQLHLHMTCTKDSRGKNKQWSYQSVVLSITDYRLGLTTVAQTNLLKLDRVQNEAMRIILGTTKDTPTETMLDFPPMQTR